MAEQKMAEQATTEMETVLATLRATNLFQTLDEALLRDLATELTVVHLAPGETLIRQGEAGDAMYVVLAGQLRVIIEDITGDAESKAQFRRMVSVHETIGEIALLTGQKRTATIIADSQAELIKLTKSSFDQLTHRSPHVASALGAAITNLIRRRQLQNALAATQLFHALDGEVRQALEAELTLCSLRSGEQLFRQGDVGDGMYIVISGRLQVISEGDGQSETALEPSAQYGVRQERLLLRELGRGETLGEIALITKQPRTASVYAIRDTEVAKLSQEGYERLVARFPVVATRTFTKPITNLVVSRDRRERPSADATLSIAVLPVRPDVLLTEFAQRLAKAFAQLGPTLYLTSRRVDEILGKDGIAQTTTAGHSSSDRVERDALDAQLVNWLGEQESEYRYLLYEADATTTAWTERTIRQADHLLLVGHGGSNPQPDEVERSLNRQVDPIRSKGQSLVLLHRGGQRSATGTARWLAPRQVQNHYHVRWHEGDGDIDRLARILAGQAVGLVLSGGGARGAAHLGVLRALHEAKIPIDLIGGVSSGSIIGALYAMGYTLDAIQDQFQSILRSVNYYSDMTLPIVAFSTGAFVTHQYKQLYGEMQIEDLFLPYFAVSANLSQARTVVHRTGELVQAVRASATVPGIAPPVVQEGDLLIDGGLYNNLPLDVMRLHNPKGTVIGVDVMPAADLADVSAYGTSLSGWRALWDRLSPQRQPGTMPTLISLLYRTLEVSSVQSINEHLRGNLADLYLRPPIAQFSFSDTRALPRIAEIGYQYAKAELAAWQTVQPSVDERVDHAHPSAQIAPASQSIPHLDDDDANDDRNHDNDNGSAEVDESHSGAAAQEQPAQENLLHETPATEEPAPETEGKDGEQAAAQDVPQIMTSKLKSAAIFSAMAERVAAKEPLPLRGRIQYNIRGVEEDGYWFVDLNRAPVVVQFGQVSTPDCTVAMADDDFVALTLGKLGPRMAFIQRKIKIEGNGDLLRKFTEILMD